MNLQAETAELIAPMPFSMAENGELARHMLETAVEYKELRMMYACAIKEVQTKFEVLNTEFNILYKRNPISSMQTRLKSSASTIEKLHRKGLSFSLENLEEHIQDMAGIRIICSYVDDIYTLAESIIKQDDITLVEKKDYIAKPQTQRIPQPPPDNQRPRVFLPAETGHEGGNPDTHHSHGLLGKS